MIRRGLDSHLATSTGDRNVKNARPLSSRAQRKNRQSTIGVKSLGYFITQVSKRQAVRESARGKSAGRTVDEAFPARQPAALARRFRCEDAPI